MSTPTRRQWLATCVSLATVSLGGCLGDDEPDEQVGEVFQPVSVEVIDPEHESITVETEVINGFAEYKPARLQVAIRNEGENDQHFTGAAYAGFRLTDLETPRREGTERLIALPHEWATDREFMLLSSGGSGWRLLPREADEGCWRLPGEPPIGPFQHTQLSEPFTLTQGEALTERLWCYGAHGGGACHPPGVYPFRTHISREGSAFVWGFNLVVH